MNYLIFGGTGFIGTHLARLLHAKRPDAHIYNLDIVAPGNPLPNIRNYEPALEPGEQYPGTFVHCDVRSTIDLPIDVTPDDVIFNLAAVHRTPGHEDIEYFETNILGAENVTEYAQRMGIRRIVFTSSIGPYGASEDLKEESTLPTPNTPYGISKLVAEKIFIGWAQGADDRQLLILRPGVVFGHGENGNFTRLYKGLKSGKFAYPGRKDTIKAAIYVKDLVGFVWWYLNHPTGKVEVYNCTFYPPHTIKEIVETMKEVTGINRFVLDLPNWLVMPAAALLGALGSPMGICPARVKKLQVSTNISGKKLAECGYPMQYTLRTALQDWLGAQRSAARRHET